VVLGCSSEHRRRQRSGLGRPVRIFPGQRVSAADQVLPNPQATTGNSGPLGQWINKAAFAVPALGTIGNSRRNEITYPATWNFDMARSRAFSITESQRLEVRAEAFNVLNSFIPGYPVGSNDPGPAFLSVSSGIFGQIRTAQNTRIMQFAMKCVF